jgi:Ferritin-like domain
MNSPAPSSSLAAALAARVSRRSALKKFGLGSLALGLGAVTAQARPRPGGTPATRPGSSPRGDDNRSNIDAQILQFALNLEYLEAEYYVRAVTGSGIDQQGDASVDITGTGQAGEVVIKPNPRVDFGSSELAAYAEEIASDEVAHVKFLRTALQAAGAPPVARPRIDLLNSFNAAAVAAGLGASFDPFADPTSFLLGAFVFEDVGVTAYAGAAPLLTSKAILGAAASILGTEAYHAGAVRTLLYQGGTDAIAAAQKISDLRDTADGDTDLDQGVELDDSVNIVPTDADGLVFRRTVAQVSQIVYLNAAGTPGGFFPDGINNGTRSTA